MRPSNAPRLFLPVVLVLASAAQAGVARAQDVTIDLAPPEPTRAELVRLRRELTQQIAGGTCVPLAREVRDVAGALLAAGPGVVRRALLRYLADQRERLSRCSIGTPPEATVQPQQPPPRPDPRPGVGRPRGLVTIARSGVRAEAPAGRDPALFARLVASRRALFLHCYEREVLASDPEARGEIELRAEVASDGRIGRVDVVERDRALPEILAGCARARLLTLRVPLVEGEDARATYVLRMRFQPDDAR